MQVTFAYAASGITQGGEASTGVAAWAVAAAANQAAAIVTSWQTAGVAARAFLDQEKQNEARINATAPDTRRCRFCIRFIGAAAESRLMRYP